MKIVVPSLEICFLLDREPSLDLLRSREINCNKKRNVSATTLQHVLILLWEGKNKTLIQP
jgi:hypothetical protein